MSILRVLLCVWLFRGLCLALDALSASPPRVPVPQHKLTDTAL